MPETPYRSPQPPCPDCEARRDATKKMLQFVEEDKRRCPECQCRKIRMWPICQGNSRSFLVKEGFWFFGWRKRRTFECKIKNAPKHLHFGCDHCDHRWMMLTATESPEVEPSPTRLRPPLPPKEL